MAFTSKAGSLIRETITKTAGSNAFTPMHSIYNAVRSMSSSKIFVGGLNYLTDDQSLRQAFTGFGEVTEAKVIVDRESGRSRGFGFVSFTSCEEASAALSGMDGQQQKFQGLVQELQGRTIRVNYATERTGGGGFRSAYGGGGGYGGSGYGDGGYRAGDGGFGGNSGGYSGDGQGDDFRGGRTSEMSRDNYKNEDGDYAGSSGKGY